MSKPESKTWETSSQYAYGVLTVGQNVITPQTNSGIYINTDHAIALSTEQAREVIAKLEELIEYNEKSPIEMLHEEVLALPVGTMFKLRFETGSGEGWRGMPWVRFSESFLNENGRIIPINLIDTLVTSFATGVEVING